MTAALQSPATYPRPAEPVGNLDGAPVTEYLYASYNSPTKKFTEFRMSQSESRLSKRHDLVEDQIFFYGAARAAPSHRCLGQRGEFPTVRGRPAEVPLVSCGLATPSRASVIGTSRNMVQQSTSGLRTISAFGLQHARTLRRRSKGMRSAGPHGSARATRPRQPCRPISVSWPGVCHRFTAF